MPEKNAARRIARRLGVRRRAAAARMLGERQLLSRTGKRQPPRSRILCYHSVGTPAWGVNDVPPALFRSHIEAALSAGYTFVPARAIAAGAAPARSLAVTFDDGLTTVATVAAPILAEYGIPWSVYVVSEWASGRHGFAPGALLDWGQLERVAATGASIGSHSVTHPDFGRLEVGRLPYELEESRASLRKALGIETDEFAIPFGQSTNWTREAMRAARAAGYAFVYAQSEERRPPGTIARTFVTRFDTTRVFTAALAGVFDRWEEWL